MSEEPVIPEEVPEVIKGAQKVKKREPIIGSIAVVRSKESPIAGAHVQLVSLEKGAKDKDEWYCTILDGAWLEKNKINKHTIAIGNVRLIADSLEEWEAQKLEEAKAEAEKAQAELLPAAE